MYSKPNWDKLLENSRGIRNVRLNPPRNCGDSSISLFCIQRDLSYIFVSLIYCCHVFSSSFLYYQHSILLSLFISPHQLPRSRHFISFMAILSFIYLANLFIRQLILTFFISLLFYPIRFSSSIFFTFRIIISKSPLNK